MNMKRSRPYLWVVIAVIAVPVAFCGAEKRHSQPSSATGHNWRVFLPRGGSGMYRSQPQERLIIGPADTVKTLTWVKPNGSKQDYPISEIGADYQDLEIRIRQDGRAIWLISWDQKKIAATLDLNSGRFTDGAGDIYDRNGQQNESAQQGIPKWAKMKGGRSLARKRFQ